MLFSSVLPIAYREELERIVFFNPAQGRVTESIIDSAHRYGVPQIVEDQGVLRFRVPAFGPVQTLYALDQTEEPAGLAGVAMFVRKPLDTMILLHLATHEDYAADGVYKETWVTPRLMATVRSTCRRIRGIRRLCLSYPHEAEVGLDSPPDLSES